MADGAGELAGVKAVVTGAGRGLGLALGLELGGRGARVAVLDVDPGAASDAAAAIEAAGAAAIGLPADVTDEQAVDSAMAAAAEWLGGIDLHVNNAGVLTLAPVLELELADWQRVLDVNTTGVFIASRAAARLMVASGRGGSIVSIASIAGRQGYATLAHYSASKFGVIGFSQALARELAPHDVTVNAVCPGVLETDMNVQLMQAWNETTDDFVAAQAIRRPQTPTDIADAISFLHRSRSITGQAVNVDGGTVFN